jgi:hypothetical protein
MGQRWTSFWMTGSADFGFVIEQRADTFNL